MAAITKRGPYQWQAKVRRKGYPSTSKTFETKIEAVAWAKQLESEMHRGVYVSMAEAERTTLYEALKRYLNEVTPSKKGAQREANRIKQWMRRPLVERPLASVRGSDLADYRDERLQEVGHNTVRLELAVISHVFKVAKTEWGMEGLTNPVSNIRKPKPPAGRDRRLLDGEERRLLDASEEPLSSIITLAIETGMRRSEIAGIRWEMVNLNHRHLFIPDTKNGEGRAVPLSTRAIRIMEKQPRKLSGYVFGDPVIVADRITHGFHKICRRAGIAGLRFHDLRHEATSRLFERGLNPMEVASITGHKSLQMLSRYTHLRVRDLAEKLA